MLLIVFELPVFCLFSEKISISNWILCEVCSVIINLEGYRCIYLQDVISSKLCI